jgi:hypothetical protein
MNLNINTPDRSYSASLIFSKDNFSVKLKVDPNIYDKILNYLVNRKQLIDNPDDHAKSLLKGEKHDYLSLHINNGGIDLRLDEAHSGYYLVFQQNHFGILNVDNKYEISENELDMMISKLKSSQKNVIENENWDVFEII